MGRLCTDMTGITVGALKVLGRVPSPDNTKAAKWLCRCTKCGKESVSPRSSIKKNKGSCKHCRGHNRTYDKIEVGCMVCGTSMLTDSRNPLRLCSSECKKEHARNKVSAVRRASVAGTVRQLLAQAKSRAKKRNLEYNLDSSWALAWLEKHEYKCPYTGVELTASKKDGSGLRGSATSTVSIDRIDSTKGYTKDNVEFVSYYANVAKHKFSKEEFITMCKSVLEHAGFSVRAKEGRRL